MEQLLGHIPEMYDDRYRTVLPRGAQEIILAERPPLLQADEALIDFGFWAPLRLVVGASDRLFYVFDVSSTPYDDTSEHAYMHGTHFLIADDTFGSAPKRGFVDLQPGDGWVSIGRMHHTDRFDYPATVSPSHFQIGCDGNANLFLRNLTAMNPTTLHVHPKVEAYGLPGTE